MTAQREVDDLVGDDLVVGVLLLGERQLLLAQARTSIWRTASEAAATAL